MTDRMRKRARERKRECDEAIRRKMRPKEVSEWPFIMAVNQSIGSRNTRTHRKP